MFEKHFVQFNTAGGPGFLPLRETKCMVPGDDSQPGSKPCGIFNGRQSLEGKQKRFLGDVVSEVDADNSLCRPHHRRSIPTDQFVECGEVSKYRGHHQEFIRSGWISTLRCLFIKGQLNKSSL
jgi:hypothetical protein